MGATYTVNLNDASGVRIAVLEQYLSLTATRVVNEIGVLTLTMPGTFDYRLLKRDYQLEVYRRPDGYRQQTLLLDTIWLIRGWTIRRDGGKRVIDILAVPLIELLKRRVCYGFGDTGINGVGGPIATAADDLMKWYILYGLGAESDYSALLVPGYTGRDYIDTSGRDISTYLSIEGNLTQCPAITYSGRNKNLFDVCKEIGEASRIPYWDGTPGVALYFDIVPNAPMAWTFRTFINQRGVDRSSTSIQPLIVSERRDNLGDSSITYDFTEEITYAIIYDDVLPVYGDAFDSDRLHASPLNRRETCAELGQYILDAARYESRVLLDREKSPVKINGVVIDSPGARFGVDWGWGDRVVAEVEGERQDVLLKSTTVTYASGQEKITAQFNTGD